MLQPLLNAWDVADYFLANAGEGVCDSVSNLKLQKLLYYAQGFHVAIRDGDPLFREMIVAWDYGPVVESIYHCYKRYGCQGIDRSSGIDVQAYPPESRELLDTVSRVYGQFSAERLIDMTHDEPPWRNTPRNEEISLESMGDFFSRIVEAGREDRSVLGEPAWPKTEFRFQQRRSISRRMATHRDRLGRIARRISDDANPWADDD